MLEVSRENLIEDCLKKLWELKPEHNLGRPDPLKRPFQIRWQGEPAIDGGGPRKEFYALIMEKLFSEEFGMFEYNPDNKLYWFKHKTLDMGGVPLNFEMFGILVGLAFYNNLQIDLPLAPVIYKLLLGEKPDIEDLAIW